VSGIIERVQQWLRGVLERLRGLVPRRRPPTDAGGAAREGHSGRLRKVAIAVLVVLGLALVASPVIMIANYRFIAPSHEGSPESRPDYVQGVAYVDAILRVHDDGMRPWLVNDRAWPTVFLDNPQNFQRGLLEAERYAVRLLRDNLTRQRSTDSLDPDVEAAFNRLAIDEDRWIFPRPEDEYAAAMDHLRSYRARLVAGQAHFYPRADSLVEVLKQFNSLTGGANTRLYNCVPDMRFRVSEETAEDPLLSGESLVRTETRWSEVDDQFYYAQGVALVYREILVACLHDFRDVLEQRKAMELASATVTDFLDWAQFEPIYVANGRFGSPWANHPYQLLGLLSQVRERSRSLITVMTVNTP